MFFLFLTLADFISYIVAILMSYGFINSWQLAFVFAFYLIGKAYVFRSSLLSLADGVVGIYLILMIFGFKFWFVYFVIGLLIYKIISLIA